MIIPIAAGMVVNSEILVADSPFTIVTNRVSTIAQNTKSPVKEENQIYFVQKHNFRIKNITLGQQIVDRLLRKKKSTKS